MRKPNYNQARKQKEQARKQRQQEKQKKKEPRPGEDGEASQPGDESAVGEADVGSQSPA